MITAQNIKDHLRELLNSSNEKTGLNDNNLTSAVNSLKAGYKTKQCIGGIHITTTLNHVEINDAGTKYTGKLSVSSPYSLDSVTLNGASIAGNTVSTNDFSSDIEVGAIYWSLSNDGGLIIAGSGDMRDYTSFTGMPWTDSRDSVSEIAVHTDITHIGARSFYRCINATKVSIPLSVKSIGDSAFYRCDAIAQVIYKGTKAEWYALMEETGTNNEVLSGAFIVCSDGTINSTT